MAGIEAAAGTAGVPVARIGTTGGDALVLPGEPPVPLADLIEAHERTLPALMGTVPA